jgi:hypothetical protein
MAAINRRNEAQKRCNASWIPTEEDREELRAARKAVRRAVEDAREAWMMRLVDEINSRESADERWIDFGNQVVFQLVTFPKVRRH